MGSPPHLQLYLATTKIKGGFGGVVGFVRWRQNDALQKMLLPFWQHIRPEAAEQVLARPVKVIALRAVVVDACIIAKDLRTETVLGMSMRHRQNDLATRSELSCEFKNGLRA